MSGRWKRKVHDDQASDGEHEGHAPANKSARKDSDDSDSIVVCELGKNKRITVRNWNGRTWIDIREFYTKDGKELPGKKGISLSMDQWKILRDHAEEIDEVVCGR